jgi:hypothetical protein
MQAQAEWKDWFALPYMKDPHESPAFSIYFSRHWQVILPNYFHLQKSYLNAHTVLYSV